MALAVGCGDQPPAGREEPESKNGEQPFPGAKELPAPELNRRGGRTGMGGYKLGTPSPRYKGLKSPSFQSDRRINGNNSEPEVQRFGVNSRPA
jgi:hypothetical protein